MSNIQVTGGASANFQHSSRTDGGGGAGWSDFFGSIGVGVANVGGKFAKGALAGGGAGGAGGAAGALGGGGSQIEQLEALFAKQAELQFQMQQFSMLSNISKTEHDSRMEVVRNMKA